MTGMADGVVFAVLGRIAVAETVVPIAHQSLGLHLGAVHPMAEYLAIRACCQQMMVAGREPCARYTAAVDAEMAATACRLHQGLKYGGVKEIAAVIVCKEVGGISQHIAQLRVARLIDGVCL